MQQIWFPYTKQFWRTNKDSHKAYRLDVWANWSEACTLYELKGKSETYKPVTTT